MTASGIGLPRTEEALLEGIRLGLHLGAQLYVSVAGEAVADGALGENRPGEPLSREHLMSWLSATKPVTAVALLQQWERGRLHLDDPIARHLPEFGEGGKGEVTLRHALTHTGGFRMLGVGWPEASWQEILERICARRLEPRWSPGRKAGYHLSSSWFVLAEVVRRLDGRPIDRYAREEVFLPLGMDSSWLGMPAERARHDAGRIGLAWDTEGERRELHPWHREDHLTRPNPGASGRGPMRELGRFYESLLEGGRTPSGGRILGEPTVEAMVARHRVGLYDHTFKHVLDWGLGLIVNSALYGSESVPYGYGPFASRRTFGHSGYRSTAAFADPERQLVVAWAANGTPSDEAHEARVRSVLGALYRDLGERFDWNLESEP